MARKKTAAPATESTRETAPRESKSEAVRQYLKDNPTASPKVVVEALNAKGLDVSAGLVSFVKYGGNKKTAKWGKARSKAAVTPAEAKSGTPATAARGSKSDAVREYLKANPGAPAKSVREALKAGGVDVSIALVGAIKYGKGKMKKSKVGRPGKAAAVPPVKSASSGNGLSASDLLDAKGLVDKLGGLAAARQALEVLEKLA